MIAPIAVHILQMSAIPFVGFPHVPAPSDEWVISQSGSCGVVDAYFIHDQNKTVTSEWFRMDHSEVTVDKYVSSLAECRASRASVIQYDIIAGTCATRNTTFGNRSLKRRISSVFEYTREYTLSERREIVRQNLAMCD